jgi:RNA polymerase-binding transcription factor DksA
MATSRSKSARPKAKASKSSRPKARPAKPAKKKAAASKSKAHAAKKVAPRPAPKPVAAKAPAKPAPKSVAKVAGKAPAKGAGTKAAGKKGAVRSSETVRPLGVLPPESIARAKDRSAARSLPSHRPAPAAPARPAPPPQGDRPLTEEDMKHFEQRLLAERAKLMREMGHLENTVLKVNQRDSSGDLSGYSFHMADAGTDAYEREKAFLFASSEGRTLLEINEALRRVYAGSYGICEISGKPISRARLEALPWARYTLEVQESLEKEERSRRGNP